MWKLKKFTPLAPANVVVKNSASPSTVLGNAFSTWANATAPGTSSPAATRIEVRDLVGLVRPFIADPQWLAKATAG